MPTDVEASTSDSPARQFVVVTADYSGLGWAKKLQDEGETVTLAVENPETKPEHKREFDQVAKGWLDTMPLSEALTILRTDSTYWIFAENCFTEQADKLRSQGQKVFGTSALAEKLEHDRKYATDIATAHGLESPPTHEFTTRQEGLAFLAENPDTAYVFKPDDAQQNHLTFVPERVQDADANHELTVYLSHMKTEPGAYILQERVHGTEVNVEAWLYEGEPFFAFATLESKRKNVGDLGEMAGCAGDFAWMLPLDSDLVTSTIGKLFPFYKDEAYTGFADVNVIFGDNGPLFLEVCNRFGYNGHISLFLGLATDTFGHIIADFIDGQTANMESRFRRGRLAASLTLFLDHPREGLPIHIADEAWPYYYPFDGYKEDDELLLAGYSNEVGVFVDCSASTVTEAAQNILSHLKHEEVSYPGMYYRTDLGDRDYPNAPNSRWHALHQSAILEFA